MRTLWKGAISFGLVNIPVKMYTATERKDVKFNFLHAPCLTPIEYQRRCPKCDVIVGLEDIVRGYQYEKGKYVVIREEDLEQIPSETTRTVDIVDFVDLKDIDPIYFEKSYYLAPADAGEKAYALLKQAMEETGKIAIAKVVIRSKQALAAIRVYDRALVMTTMFYPDEIRAAEAIPELARAVAVHDKERQMAVSLVTNLASDFKPEKYTDEYREALLAIIHSKIAGEEVAIPEKPAAGKVVDLMEALKASIELAKKERREAGREAPRPRKRRAKTS